MISGQKNKTVEEYRALDVLSSSDLKLFSQDRRAFFKKRIIGEEEVEEYNRAQMIGNLAHCLLLEPEAFDSRYMMSICGSVPTGLMLAFVEALYRHTLLSMDRETGEVVEDFSKLTEKAYGESGFKISLDAVLRKFTDSEAERYYQELRESGVKGLTVVCVEDINIANSIIEHVRQDENVGPIFNFEGSEDEDVHNEIKIEGFTVEGVQMKMMADKVIVNHRKKTIKPYDLKVTWDSVNFYREYYLKKGSYIQAYVYDTGIRAWAKRMGYDDYEVIPPTFVAVDSSNFYAPLMFELSTIDLVDATEGFEVNGRVYKGVSAIIEEIKWAQETGNWKISKQAYEDKGIVKLKP